MKTIVLDGYRVVAAGDSVLLFPDHGIINPSEPDEAGHIHEGERLLYINDSMVLREVDALPDPWVPGAYVFADGEFALAADSDAWRGHLRHLELLKAELSDQIDGAVAEVYARWLRFDAEYVAREAAAREYLANGTMSDWVAGFATPAALPMHQAATLIVQQADALHLALKQLGALRMRKYEVKAAPTSQDATDCAHEILAQIAEVAAGLQ